MKKLYNTFLVLAIIGVVCMRFAFAPQKTPNNLFVNDVVAAMTDGKLCVVNKNGKIVASISREDIEKSINADIKDMFLYKGFDMDGFAAYCYIHYKIPPDKGGIPWIYTGYINTKGELVLDNDFAPAGSFTNGLAPVTKEGKSGYIDTKGNAVIDFIYEETKPFNDGSIAPVRIESRYGYINRSGEIVIERQFDEARSVVNGIAVAANERLVKAWSEERGSYMATEKDYCLINDKSGEMIPVDYDEVADFAENGLAAVRQGTLYGYIDDKGETVITPQFIEAGEFGNGLAPVKTEDEKWCYINDKGEIVLEFENTIKLGSFHNGLAWVVNENREYGYVNTDGEMVIEQKFVYNGDDMDFHSDGYAVVNKEIGKQGIIDKQGNYVLEPIYDYIG